MKSNIREEEIWSVKSRYADQDGALVRNLEI